MTIRRLLTIMLIVALAASPVLAGTFQTVVVFGDSLSDNGNLLLVPDRPRPDPQIYYEGRFSNGPVWVEYLADSTRLNASLTDLALGGARSGGLVPPGLVEQVAGYLATRALPLPSDALFVVWIGGNDFLNGDGDDQAAVDNIEDALSRLARAGAGHLLILNLPDLGKVPTTLNTPEAVPASDFTFHFNSRLMDMLDAFAAAYPQVGLYAFDAFSFFEQVRSDPTAYGLSNVTEPSPNFAIPDNFDGAGHLFWDAVHPTTRMHERLADDVYAYLNEQVPLSDGDNPPSPESSDHSCFIGVLSR